MDTADMTWEQIDSMNTMIPRGLKNEKYELGCQKLQRDPSPQSQGFVTSFPGNSADWMSISENILLPAH